MSAALRLVEPLSSTRPSLVPTLAPAPHLSAVPMSAATARPTEAPPTQRCATVHPRFEVAARIDTMNLIAVLRLNADFLGTLLGDASPLALATVEELQKGIDRLEDRLVSSLSIDLLG